MHIAVTLVERDFLYGACALFNSLLSNGFAGRYVIGCRHQAEMPDGLLKAITNVAEGRIEWMQVDTPLHFGNYKPFFMQRVLERYSLAEKITYLDPDIICCCPFSWINSWSDGGPALCADVNWLMPPQHPTRREWLRLSGLAVRRELHLYFNSGFLSVRREDGHFLKLWSELIENVGNRDNPLDGKGDIAQWRRGGRWLPFFSPNQDTLNLAAMVWEGELTALGPDVMAFTGNGGLPHALGARKPWRKNYLKEALRGNAPRLVDKVFWANALTPIPIASAASVRFKRMSITLASALGRIYRRR